MCFCSHPFILLSEDASDIEVSSSEADSGSESEVDSDIEECCQEAPLPQASSAGPPNEAGQGSSNVAAPSGGSETPLMLLLSHAIETNPWSIARQPMAVDMSVRGS